MGGGPIRKCPVHLDPATVDIALVGRVATRLRWIEISLSPLVPRAVGVLVERTGTS